MGATSRRAKLPSILVLLGGSCRAIPVARLPIRRGRVVITQAPLEPRALHAAALTDRPDWLLLGEGPQEQQLQELAATARSARPEIRVAVLGPADDTRRVEGWLRRSAFVCLPYAVSLQKLSSTLRFSLSEGMAVIDDSFVELAQARQARMHADLAALLSPRQLEVALLLARGLSNAAISVELSITDSTVVTHVGEIMRRLHVNNRTEAADHIRTLGLFRTED